MLKEQLSWENYKAYKEAKENNFELGVESFNFQNLNNPYECGYIYVVDDPSYKGNMGIYMNVDTFESYFK